METRFYQPQDVSETLQSFVRHPLNHRVNSYRGSARIFLSIHNMLFLYELSNDATASHPELHPISSDLFLLT
jgi:queuine/archaeosine tRNA-ribosyltransferase